MPLISILSLNKFSSVYYNKKKALARKNSSSGTSFGFHKALPD